MARHPRRLTLSAHKTYCFHHRPLSALRSPSPLFNLSDRTTQKAHLNSSTSLETSCNYCAAQLSRRWPSVSEYTRAVAPEDRSHGYRPRSVRHLPIRLHVRRRASCITLWICFAQEWLLKCDKCDQGAAERRLVVAVQTSHFILQLGTLRGGIHECLDKR